MEGLIESVHSRYNSALVLKDVIIAARDPRVREWPLMATPWPTLVLCVLYVCFVVSWGPRFMRNREPYQLRKTMALYNFSMVCLSAYMLAEFMLSGWVVGYSLCQTPDWSENKQALRMASVCWLYFFSKFVEFFDTMLFIARKKLAQVTFLHVYHHTIMAASWWVVVTWQPGGSVTLHALLNCLVHVAMYAYYGLSALGPAFHKYLWWKRYLTRLQLVQFVLVLSHSVYVGVLPSCDVTPVMPLWVGSYAVVFFMLFMNFYLKAYFKGERPAPSINGKSSTNGAVTNGVHKTHVNGVTNGHIVDHNANGISLNGSAVNWTLNGIHKKYI